VLFNGYYHDEKIAALNEKNPSSQIEEYIPLGPSGNPNSTHEASNSISS
jgi:hypothetical protein